MQATRNGPNQPGLEESQMNDYTSQPEDSRKLALNDLRASDQSATATAAARLRIADVLKTPNRFGFQPNMSHHQQQLQPSIHQFDPSTLNAEDADAGRFQASSPERVAAALKQTTPF